MIQRKPTTNPNLASLTAPVATELIPAFATNTLAYTLALPYAMDALQITPSLVEEGAKVSVNGTLVTSGSLSQKKYIQLLRIVIPGNHCLQPR